MVNTCHAAGVKVIAGMSTQFPSLLPYGEPLYLLDIVFNHMAGLDSGTGVAGSSALPPRPKPSHCLTAYSQVSPTTIILESTNHKTSTTVVLLVTTFNNGTIPSKSRTVSSLTSQSSSLLKHLVRISN